MTLADRLNARTDKSAPSGCWMWTGAKRRDGYGAIAVGGGHRSIVRPPHRVAWELAYGPTPAGLFVLHARIADDMAARRMTGTNVATIALLTGKG